MQNDGSCCIPSMVVVNMHGSCIGITISFYTLCYYQNFCTLNKGVYLSPVCPIVTYHGEAAQGVSSPGFFCCCSMFVCLLLLFHQMLQSIAHLAVSTEWVSSQTKTKVHLSLCHGPVCMITPSRSTVISRSKLPRYFPPPLAPPTGNETTETGGFFFLDGVLE